MPTDTDQNKNNKFYDIPNPYLEEYCNCQQKLYDNEWNISSKLYYYRNSLVFKYSWAIPDENALKIISKYSPIIEIGAGLGYWASLLNQAGCDIICFDDGTWKNKRDKYYKVECRNEWVIPEYQNRTLFLCWPPYDNDMAYTALRLYQGETLIFVGEGYGGCTGNDRFFKELKSFWELSEDIYIPQWDGLRDCLYIYNRK
jgi:hypothetical protein